MLLSIVMMIKNEERYLDTTLSSLVPLMKDINSELIILDTGSTDKSIDIAKKYTQNIYFANWNDNFSDMRNKSISYAKGDWILILDADEELKEYEKLINFFNTDLCRKYNCASIELKNITSEDESIYVKGSVLRIFKNSKSFKYKGAIHEQPVYKGPIYKDLMKFNHYGYMFINEEVRQKKIKRNEKILLSELKLNPNDPYIYYQLGKNYDAGKEKEEALYYMEKAFKLYENLKQNYIPVKSDLAMLYCDSGKYLNCEKICEDYIKMDDKNIDIYYYLALSKKSLGKYEESLSNFKKYLYLIENYELSTQANDICCIGTSVSFSKSVNIDMINIYYILEMYDEIIEKVKTMELDDVKEVNYILLMSMYKLKREKDILNLNNQNLNTQVEKIEFRMNLEKMILDIKQTDREKIYEILTCIDDNYGLLNKVRMGKILTTKEYNEILLKEKDSYYADLIYYGLKQELDLIFLLKDVDSVSVQNYLDYLVTYRRDCIVDLYNYLIEQPNSLDLNKLVIYMCLSKSLLFRSNLMDDKYENLFLMYITYQYDYLKQIYDEDLNNQDLLRFIKNKEDRFVINIKTAQEIYKTDKLEYIRKLKMLIIENQEYKKGIKILINKFEKEFEESEELRQLKEKYKFMIEENIRKNNLSESIKMIKEYEKIYMDSDMLNVKSVISIYMGDLKKADKLSKLAYVYNSCDENVLFNIGYLKELLGEYKEANKFYKKVLEITNDEDLKIEINDKLVDLKIKIKN